MTIAALAVLVLSATNVAASAAAAANLDVSQRATNESEETVAVNPTNPNNIAIVSNVVVPAAGMFAAVSFDGGKTWARRLIAANDNLGAACCDPSLSFDAFGNLFLTYLFNVGNTVPVALSTDGGLNFTLIGNIANPSTQTAASSERRGLFRFVDQPTIVAGHGEVWLVLNPGVRWWPPAPGSEALDRSVASGLRDRHPRRRVRLHPAPAESTGRRRTRPGLGPDRRSAQWSRLPRLDTRSEERER